MNYSLEENLKGLNEASNQIFQNNKAKGFWDKDRNVGEMLMLVTSELGEAMEAHRKGKFSNTKNLDRLINDGYSWDDSPITFSSYFTEDVKDTFEDEIADSIIRLLDLSAGLGIDIEKHINAKVKFNISRPKLHGKEY